MIPIALFFSAAPILAILIIAIVHFNNLAARTERLRKLARDDWGRAWAGYYAACVHCEAIAEQDAILPIPLSAFWRVRFKREIAKGVMIARIKARATRSPADYECRNAGSMLPNA